MPSRHEKLDAALARRDSAHASARDQSLRVRDVMERLARMPQDAPLIIWLPGSRLWLTGFPAQVDGAVMLEANIAEGSALSSKEASS